MADGGNTFALATWIEVGTFSGVLSSTDLHDYYKMNVTNGGLLEITITLVDGATGGSLGVNLYDNDGTVLNTASTNDPLITADTWYLYNAKTPAIGYFDMYLIGTTEWTNYSFTTTFTAENEGSSGKDAGESFALPTTVLPGTWNGMVASGEPGDTYADEDDYYMIRNMAVQELESIESGSTGISRTGYCPKCGNNSVSLGKCSSCGYDIFE
jgi:hypothetical protein